jgi:hypothetical protein
MMLQTRPWKGEEERLASYSRLTNALCTFEHAMMPTIFFFDFISKSVHRGDFGRLVDVVGHYFEESVLSNRKG